MTSSFQNYLSLLGVLLSACGGTVVDGPSNGGEDAGDAGIHYGSCVVTAADAGDICVVGLNRWTFTARMNRIMVFPSSFGRSRNAYSTSSKWLQRPLFGSW